MQKLVRRTQLARNQAQRKAIRATKSEKRAELRASIRETFAYNRYHLDNVRAERLQRREDWMRGPLAPQRDAGFEGKSYGALHPRAMRPPAIPQHLRREYINFAPGDRVCIMKGRDKGRIETVSRVDAENETLIVNNCNAAEVHFPEWLTVAQGSKGPFQTVPLPIPMDDVRLVAALDDPATGQTRDVLVEHIHSGAPFIEREHGVETPKHTRYIAGENIEIPWPRADKPEFKDEDWDTLRMEVETPTWVPSLHEPPFPPSVLDELRNKYSAYRTRHDPEFVEEKRMQDLKREYLESRSLMTPKGELMAMLQKKKADELAARRNKNGNLRADQETRSFIEEFMLQNGSPLLKSKKGMASKTKKSVQKPAKAAPTQVNIEAESTPAEQPSA